MKLTLTKALRLRSALEEKIKLFDLKPTVSLDLDSARVSANPTEIVLDASSAITERLKTYERLSLILQRLRTAVAKANAENGVEEVLAHQGHIERVIAKIKQLVSAPRVELDTIENKIARRRDALKAPQAPASRLYGQETSDSITFNTVTAEQVVELEKQLATLRREKVDLEDKRSVLNARTEIEIGDDDYALLVEQAVV